jgi:2-methylcitrate dehydratase PrpD
VSLLHGAAGLAQFSDAAALDAEVGKMRQRVGIAPDPSLDKMAARIRTDTISLDAPASRPMDDARLEAKLRSLAGARASDLLEMVRTLEALPRVSLP